MFSEPAFDLPQLETAPVLHQVIDRQHGGVVAWAFSHPVGWTAHSDVHWNFQNMSFPVTSYAQVMAPDGIEGFEFLPAEAFCWVEPDYGMAQPGQSSLGQTYLQPMPAVDALVRWMVPKYCGGRQGLQVVSAGPMSTLAADLGFTLPGGLPSEGAGVRVAYVENGRSFEEELYGVQVLQRVPYHGPMGTIVQINWGFARAFRFRAAAGSLDARKERFWRIARSARVNPLWEQLCAGVMQQLQAQFDQHIQMGYSQIQAAGQLSRSISAVNDAMLHTFQQQRQAAYHSSHASNHSTNHSPNDRFSDSVRGVETVEDPYWGESQQDANYQYHWTNSQGNYQHSDDPFFNPNIGSTQSWTLMKPKP